MVDARQEHDSAQQMAKQRQDQEREKRLKSFKGQRLTPHSPSDFHHHGINSLRAMVAHANPGTIETAGTHWRASADLLGGSDGHGGVRKKFMDAIDHASKHWSGAAAEAFRREAVKVLSKIDRTYQHARNMESSLIGTRESGPEIGLAHNVREAMKAMAKIHDPGTVDSAMDSSGDDSQFHRDMADPHMDARQALELNRDSLSLSKERQVEAVIVMDELADHYTTHSQGWVQNADDGVHGDWPTHPTRTQPPPPVRMPTTGDAHPHPSSTGTHQPNGVAGGAVPDGFDGPKAHRPELPVTTGLDSVQGGTMTPTSATGIPSTGGPGVGHGVSGGPGGFPGGMPPGVFGVPGGPGSGGGRGPSGAGGLRGGGMPGAGGVKGGKSGEGALGRGGAQARTRGGVAGKPGGPAGGAKQGGSGLHRSRGGQQAGGAAGARGKDQKKEKGGSQRPDYLVEDEETWTAERQVAPRVIE
ncbi:hypothetical protein [Streptomyces natalensis]|uniref:PPE family domain-containing protein n=1 Tax=Streptomyces natalensis ATCC 27448 TaxID=1240678 RepID=A0A0D7CEK1_9ACTN|nr:hypothetical protein [Streptomyces natalensis]KIZ14486.1 hypothetical protein SNA_36020 [Streptomyces natalensis ATCC 27448]